MFLSLIFKSEGSSLKEEIVNLFGFLLGVVLFVIMLINMLIHPREYEDKEKGNEADCYEFDC